MVNENDNNKNPERDDSNAMNSKKDVENSNDNKIDQDFPGYPHYPAREDVMNENSDLTRVNKDVENIPASNDSGVSKRFLAGQSKDNIEEAMIPGPATDNDLDNAPNQDDNNKEK